MKVLHVLRHAKSSWDAPGLPDHDRPLAPRGRRAATRLAVHVRHAGIAPELVLCSSARRARETLERLDLRGPEIAVEGALYRATADDLLERLRAVPGAIRVVLLVGHNPAIQQLTLTLAGTGAARERVSVKFPTAGLATLAAPIATWADLGPAAAELVGFVVPRGLE